MVSKVGRDSSAADEVYYSVRLLELESFEHASAEVSVWCMLGASSSMVMLE